MLEARLRTIAPGDRMTVEEFFEVAPEDRKAELIDGVIVIPSLAHDPHENVQGFIFSVLRIYANSRDIGIVRGSRTALKLGIEYHAYEPDILFVSRERSDIVKEEGVFGAPDLVIEILSRGTKTLDRGLKRWVYAAAGVAELWLIDPDGEKRSRFYQRPSATAELVEVKFVEGVLHSTTVPGFFLRVEWFWTPSGELPNELDVLRALGVI
ncbi:MAG: hypothetical protein A2Z04_03335 [Chloroflexi bacterium RBG_16_57_9]|nr:MAG: hypothetical protein A2Z04_03335 [Chloroflexi bacterium RBG_16_57_9]